MKLLATHLSLASIVSSLTRGLLKRECGLTGVSLAHFSLE